MSCKATKVSELYFEVNGLSAYYDSVLALGFLLGPMVIAPEEYKRDLMIRVSEAVNNSRIVCIAYNITSDFQVSHEESEVAILQVEGIYYYYENRYTGL